MLNPCRDAFIPMIEDEILRIPMQSLLNFLHPNSHMYVTHAMYDNIHMDVNIDLSDIVGFE
jgi:hypothetical protein